MFEELMAKRDAAQTEQYRIQGVMNNKKYELERAVNAEINRLFGPQMAAAKQAVAAAEAELTKARNEHALAQVKVPFPIGTVMTLWEEISKYNRQPGLSLRKTAERGVIEVITTASVHPENKGTYSHASVGSVVIRLLKSNGKPGKQYVKWDGTHYCLWAPEGVDLNAQRNAAEIAKLEAAAAEKRAAEEKFAADVCSALGL